MILSGIEFLIAVFAAIFFCAVAYYKKWLTVSGAIAAALLGIVILVTGGFSFAVPMLMFFITGSLFGKLKSHSKISDESAKKARNYKQVFCNGGVAVLCLFLFAITKKGFFISAYFLSISISTSDTWSSELGLYFKGEVVDIMSFKKLEKGSSGGISLPGTLAGFSGAFFIALLHYLLYAGNLKLAIMISLGGFIGMLLDSILGSTQQGMYLLENGSKSETPDPDDNFKLLKGRTWMTNDLVNLVSNLVITALFIVCAILR